MKTAAAAPAPLRRAVVTIDDDFALQADDFVAVADCRQSALFRIGSIDRVGRAATLNRPAQSGPFGNRTGQPLSLQQRPFGGDVGPGGAAVGRAVTEIYFVARGAGVDSRGRDVWSLWRKTTAGRRVELVQGVIDLQVLFGVDHTPDDDVVAPSRYVLAGEVGAGAVRAVYFEATVTSADGTGMHGEELIRSFAWTVALRN